MTTVKPTKMIRHILQTSEQTDLLRSLKRLQCPTPAVHVAHKLTVAPCLSTLPLPILESVSQGSGQRHMPVALDVFPIADSVHREEKALIDGHVRVPKQIEADNIHPPNCRRRKAVSLKCIKGCVFVRFTKSANKYGYADWR